MRRLSILVIIACVGLLIAPAAAIGKNVKDVNVVNTVLPVTLAPGTPIEVTVPVDEPLPVTVAPDNPIPVTVSTDYQFVGYSVAKVGPSSGIVLMHRICQESYGLAARMCTTKEFWTSPQMHFPAEKGAAWIQPSIVGYALVNGRTWVVDFSGAQIDMEDTTCGQWTEHWSATPWRGTALSGYSNVVITSGCGSELEVTCCTPATP